MPHPIPTDPRFKDLTGLVKGKLTLEAFQGKTRHGSSWSCRCHRGHLFTVLGSSFVKGRYANCPQCRTDKPDEMECRQCKRTLPFDKRHFPTSNQHVHGLRVQCKECVKPSVRRFAKAAALKLRTEVLTHYSGGTPACACCGETAWEFLALDHINGGGRRHHKELHGKVLAALRRQGYPAGYRVLCHNCNECFRTHGFCVHQPPEGREDLQPIYNKEWRLSPTESDLFARRCIHCNRTFPRSEEFFPTHPRMGDGLLNCCHDCNRHSQAQRSRSRAARAKRAAFGHYSNGRLKCECCKTTEFAFLTIDHIRGGGTAHRKQVPGQNVVAWLVKQKFPAGFRVLCYSCNMARGFYGGVCPHERVE